MLSSELEFCLNEAFQNAQERRHEFMTVEHLLLALLDIPKVHEILKACDADMGELRRQLVEFIDEATPLMAPDEDGDVQPTLGFQRVCSVPFFTCSPVAKRKSRAATCWWPFSAKNSLRRSTSWACRTSHAWTW